ncbi:MAG: hypothetical protein M1838_003749 [Thelocarpon superellum]|nr:MAG: hypothetical protein M1838_003749 [Thelocarpon superellum]
MATHSNLEVAPLQPDQVGMEPMRTDAPPNPYRQPDSAFLHDPDRKEDGGYGPTSPQPRRVCGLRLPTFILSVALIFVIILAAAVGGGVGGSEAAKENNNSNSATATVTVTATSAAPGATRTAAAGQLKATSNCTSLGSNYVSLLEGGWAFDLLCNTDYVGIDMFGVTVFTFQDCMNACASYNRYNGTDACVGVSYVPEWASYTVKPGGDCFLKSQLPAANSPPGNGLSVDSAKLQT